MASKSLSVPKIQGFSVWHGLKFVLTLGGLVSFPAWFALGLIFGAWYAFELNIARPPMFWMGEPVPADSLNPFTMTRTLRNQGFILGYSDLRGNPLWAVYALAPPTDDITGLIKPERFTTDWRSINRVSHDDYNGSDYERGPLAPGVAIGLVYGREGQLDAYRMTNATPQKAGLSEKLWVRLENLESGPFAKQFGKIWVVDGPIFDPPFKRLRSPRRVDIPDAFYKIIVAPEAKKCLAFIIPQTVRGDEPLEHYLTSVDSIEKRTGFDFFPLLDDGEENRMEAEADPEPWHLHELLRLPVKPSHKSDKREDSTGKASQGNGKP